MHRKINDHIQTITSPGLPAPTRALEIFPTAQAVEDAGIQGLSLDQARLVSVVLSLFIGKGRAKTRSKVGIAMDLLVPACRIEFVRDGKIRPAALPDLPTGPWPHGETGLNQLGIVSSLLDGYWRTAKNRADDACLPLAWLLAFVSAPLWLAVLALIKWGPYEAGVRAEETIALLADTPIRQANRRRAEGSVIAKGTLENRAANLWALMQAIVEVREKIDASANPSLPLELVDQWHAKPRHIDVKACGARDAHLDTSGPPIEDCSENLRRLYREWQTAPSRRRYMKLRRLVLQALLALYGPRKDALRMVDIDDYLPDHVASDGVRGPILRLFPGKTKDPDEAYLLPLPQEVASWLEAWIELTGRKIGQQGSPMWPSRKPKAGQPIKRISSGGMYCAIAGREGSNGRGDQRAMLPRDDNPNIGFHPHAFRHTAYTAAKRAGVKAKERRPVEFAHVDPEDFGRAVCGHSLDQSVKDIYRDLRQVYLARAAVECAWEVLWQGGKRYGLDPEAIVRHRHEVTMLTLAASQLEHNLAATHHQQDELAERARRLSGDALHAALIESNRLATQSQRLIRDLTRVSERRKEAGDRLAAACETLVALPDDLTPEEHAERLAAALAEGADEETSADGPLAAFLTVTDLAELYGRSPQAINAWYRDGFPGGRSYWDQEAWAVSGPRSKLLPVSAINQTLLTDVQREQLRAIRQRRALSDAA